jgi:hypothetical protein
MRPVSDIHSVGIDHMRRATGREQKHYGGDLAHEPSGGLGAQS